MVVPAHQTDPSGAPTGLVLSVITPVMCSSADRRILGVYLRRQPLSHGRGVVPSGGLVDWNLATNRGVGALEALPLVLVLYRGLGFKESQGV